MNYDELLKNFGLQLKMQRIKKGISQSELTILLSYNEHYISDVERGKRNITLKTINKIANALGVEESKFFNFKD